MRSLIIILLIVVFHSSFFAQKNFIFPEKYFEKSKTSDDIQLSIKILFKPFDLSGVGSVKYSGSVDTVSNGYFFINKNTNSFGIGTDADPNKNGLLSNAFFGFPTDQTSTYDSVLANRIFDLEEITYEQKFSKVMFFEMRKMLIESTSDSIALFFKYAIYDLINNPQKLYYNFDVKLYHKMIIVPFNEVILLKDLSEHFEDYTISLAITKTTKEERELYSKFTSRNFYEINEATKESKIKNEKFNLGLEFVRSDKENQNILLRQLEYPLESASILKDEENDISINLATHIYKGEFKVPFTIMNQEKADKYSAYKSSENFLQSTYNIFLVPIEYSNENLVFDIFIEYTKVQGFFPKPIKKKLTLEKGRKLKLEIPTSKNLYEFNVNSEYYKIDGYDDYDKYINEYVIVSFEYAKEK